MVEISCPNCHESYRVNDDVVGSTVECSVCHSTFTATASSISLKPIKPSTAVPLQSHCTKEKKWIVLLTAVCAMTVIQFSMLIVLVAQRVTSAEPSLIAGQTVASLPPGTPSELLLKYTEQGEISYVKSVLKQNPSFDVNRPRSTGNKTLLYIACENGYSDIVKLLLEQKADATDCDTNPGSFGVKYGFSPLTIAAKNGHLAAVKALLSAGVDIESRDANNRTALYAAVANNKPAVVQFLCESKANVNVYGINKWTPLTVAADRGSVEIVKILLKYGTNVDLELRDDIDDFYRKTPLYHAAKEGHPDIVELLCKAGADVDANQGTGFDIFKAAKKPEVMKILKRYSSKRHNE